MYRDSTLRHATKSFNLNCSPLDYRHFLRSINETKSAVKEVPVSTNLDEKLRQRSGYKSTRTQIQDFHKIFGNCWNAEVYICIPFWWTLRDQQHTECNKLFMCCLNRRTMYAWLFALTHTIHFNRKPKHPSSLKYITIWSCLLTISG